MIVGVVFDDDDVESGQRVDDVVSIIFTGLSLPKLFG